MNRSQDKLISSEFPWLFRVGLCGIDEGVTPQFILERSARFQGRVEWGLLFRPEKEGSPRFPRMAWVEETCWAIAKSDPQIASQVHFAGHLCSSRCEQIFNGDPTFVQKLCGLGFQRVQLNATVKNGVDTSKFKDQVHNVAKCVRAVPAIEWILQYNQETKAVFDALRGLETFPNVSFLFDESVGTGMEITNFPCPIEALPYKCGYAGGIGPENVKVVLSRLSSLVEDARKKKEYSFTIWIDMESKIRDNETDEISPKKIDAVLQQCFHRS